MLATHVGTSVEVVVVVLLYLAQNALVQLSGNGNRELRAWGEQRDPCLRLSGCGTFSYLLFIIIYYYANAAGSCAPGESNAIPAQLDWVWDIYSNIHK